VYRIGSDVPTHTDYALKVFKRHYRKSSLAPVCEALADLTVFPGLQVCERRCLTRDNAAGAISQFPDLEYAILMPWIRASSWFDLLALGKRGTSILSREDCLSLAGSAARTLATLEQAGIAHCDISSGNVLVDPVSFRVQLIDVEELFVPNWPAPSNLPTGTPGYQHPNAARRVRWAEVADRFAAAILLSEMLGWYDQRVRQASFGESYFESSELQSRASKRFLSLRRALEPYELGVESLLDRAWHSHELRECPTLTEWSQAIPATYSASPHSPSAGAFTPFWNASAHDHLESGSRVEKRAPITWQTEE
jgi:serine/threonine protein kinase